MLIGMLIAMIVVLAAGCAVLVIVVGRLRRQRDQREAQIQRFTRLLCHLYKMRDAVLFVRRDGACANVGQPPGMKAERSCEERLPAAERPTFRKLLAEALEQGESRDLRYFEGGRWVEVAIFPLEIDAAEPIALVFMRDVTAQERALESMRQLANRNNAILRSSMDGFFVVGEDYRFIEVNDAFCRMTGYSGQELLRMKISDLEVRHQATGGVPSHTRTGLHQFPTAHRHKDGHIIYLEISVNVHHNDGRKILVGFARDVTGRKRAQEEFARLSRQHRLILDSADEGIFGIDRDGLATFVNPAAARWLGSRGGELIGRSMHPVICGADCLAGETAAGGCRLEPSLARGSHQRQVEGVFRRADGGSFPAEFSVTPIYEGTTVIGAVVVFRDTTERKRAEEQRRALEQHVQQAQKLESLGLLAGGIAHDLNNMLVGILGNACLAQEQLADTPRVDERLQRIIGACERASKVISQILAYSGQVSCDPGPLEINGFVHDMAELMRPGVPKNITLETETHGEPLMTLADAGQLQQVVSNLIVNAAEAIGDDPGQIRLRTAPREIVADEVVHLPGGQHAEVGLYVALMVEDTGCGIPSAKLERIFEPFYSQKGPGRGLGLAAMHGIVRAHDGAVLVESKLGEGTRFTVLLPARPELVIADSEPAPAEPASAAAGTTILVIDDEEDIREVVQDILESRSLEVLTAVSGEEGVEVFEQHADRIALVLLDMTMPGMSGAEVLARIRQIRPAARVIIASGYTESNLTAELGDNRPAAFLRKPFTLSALLSSVQSVLDGSAVASSDAASRAATAE